MNISEKKKNQKMNALKISFRLGVRSSSLLRNEIAAAKLSTNIQSFASTRNYSQVLSQKVRNYFGLRKKKFLIENSKVDVEVDFLKN